MWHYQGYTLWGWIKDKWKYTLLPAYLLVMLSAIVLILIGMIMGKVIYS